MHLLDTVITKQKEYSGVIDYATKRHVTMYCFNNNDDTDIRIISMIWRLSHKNTRFSVFCKTFFPQLDIPEPIIIPIKSILNTDGLDITIPDSNIKMRRFTLS